MERLTRWRALHCFLSDVAGLERYLLEVVAPEMERLLATRVLTRWFYIFYSEGGHHLRLRVWNLDDVQFQSLTDKLRLALQVYVPSSAAAAPGEGAVLTVPYNAEIQRYGGRDAMPVAEDLFCASSRLAVASLNKIRGNLQARMALGANLMIAGVGVLDLEPGAAVDFFDTYAAYWERFQGQRQAEAWTFNPVMVRSLGERYPAFRTILARPVSETEGIAAQWARAVGAMAHTYRDLGERGFLREPETGERATTPEQIGTVLRRVLTSQVHMMNNRIRVYPALECQLGGMLARSIADNTRRSDTPVAREANAT